MSKRKTLVGAFTLVELLVVIAILVLLISMLLPVVGRAKDVARNALCQNNMHLMGEYGQTFAAQNDGRGPGWGLAWNVSTGWTSSVSWANILNTTVLSGAPQIQRMGTSPGKGTIYCPNMKPWNGNLYPRAYKWNDQAQGDGYAYPDPANANNYLFAGMSVGKYVQRPPGYGGYPSYGEVLGAVLMRFPNPRFQFLASEGERGNDSCPRGTSTPPFGVTLGDDPTHPPWSALSGQAAFRHLWPIGARQVASSYQGPARANYVFVDGHVEGFGPNDNVNSSARFAYR